MSDRGSNFIGHSYMPFGSRRLDPSVTGYSPGFLTHKNMASQVSALPTPVSRAHVLILEEQHANLRGEVCSLTELYHELCSSIDKLKRGGRPVTVGPFQEQDLIQSHLHAMRFKQELEELSLEVHKSVDGVADVEKVNGTITPKANPTTPPHLRAASVARSVASPKSLAPHLRGKNKTEVQERTAVASPNNRLFTDGPVDTIPTLSRSAPVPSPPLSPVTMVQEDMGVGQLSLNTWKPHFLTTLKPLTSGIMPPATGQAVTFHPQFLNEHLGGNDWSPGLKFVPGDKTCIIKNRTYYVLDPTTEPYLPEYPGQHGAKLTAFFNEAPEDAHGDLPGGSKSYENVPMFVKQDGRYAYFGNYSQTRWSDKLDYDTMMAHVPQHVKEFWATELASPVRQPWVTEELKKHFFKKPEYEGRIYAEANPEEDTTVTSEDEIKLRRRMAKDIEKYIEELREWEREAKMKTSMIKKQFILDAFNAADADNPPALRLWWEYLECVDWKKDFYDVLVQLQSREKRYLK